MEWAQLLVSDSQSNASRKEPSLAIPEAGGAPFWGYPEDAKQ